MNPDRPYMHRRPPRPAQLPPEYAADPMVSPPPPEPPSTEPGSAPAPDEEHSPPREPWSRGAKMAMWSLVLFALVLRLRDPLSSFVIGAEDPYLHMERTWDLLGGRAIEDYPAGFMVLLAPLALLGPDTFYWAIRFLPPLTGAVAAAGMFVLCRTRLGLPGAIAATLMMAIMPEHIRRTNIMFPTAFDLAVLPFLFHGVLRLSEGDTTWRWKVVAMGGFLLAIHPWFIAMSLPPLALFGAILYVARRRPHPARAIGFALGAIIASLLVLVLLPVWNPVRLITNKAWPRLMELMRDPGSLTPLPALVEPVTMFTWAIIVLAFAGAVMAVMRPTALHLLALVWTIMLAPLVFINWFDIWFLAHRTAVFLGVGLVLLGGIAVAEGLRHVNTLRARLPALAAPRRAGLVRFGTLSVVLALVLVASLPSAAATTWYRLYDEDDYQAWYAIEDAGTGYVVTGSWQSRAGYRAITGGDGEFNPDFFHSSDVRQQVLADHPQLVVLVDKYARDEGLPTEFLQGWRNVGTWGDVAAYQRD